MFSDRNKTNQDDKSRFVLSFCKDFFAITYKFESDINIEGFAYGYYFEKPEKNASGRIDFFN